MLCLLRGFFTFKNTHVWSNWYWKYINIIWPFWAVVSFFDFEEYKNSFKKATEYLIKVFNQPSFLGKNVFYAYYYFTIFTSWMIADKQTIIKTRNCHYNILLLWNWKFYFKIQRMIKHVLHSFRMRWKSTEQTWQTNLIELKNKTKNALIHMKTISNNQRF